jgi:hypothetical protein
MAYSTGAGATSQDFMDALRAFALGQGWTIDKYDTTAKVLFLRKAQCFATFWWGATGITQRHYNGTTSGEGFTDRTDGTISGALATSINSALSTYHSHPGSLVTSSTDADRVYCNDMVGPFTAWHFYSGDEGAGDPAYIHCVVQTAADRYHHLSLGNIDKRGMTHAGAGYMTSHYSYWSRVWYDVTNGSASQARPGNQALPFTCRDYTYITQTDAKTGGNWNLHNTSNQTTLYTLLNQRDKASTYPGNDSPRILGSVTGAYAPMYVLPVFIYNIVDQQICYLGDFPNVRLINMESLLPGQVVALSADNWVVYPCVRQAPWDQSQNVAYPMAITSGQYGIAYKKVL